MPISSTNRPTVVPSNILFVCCSCSSPSYQLWSPPTSSLSNVCAVGCSPLAFSESSVLDCRLGWALIASPYLLVWLMFPRGRHLLSTLKSLSKRVSLSSLCSITPHSKKNTLKMAFALSGRQWVRTNAWSAFYCFRFLIACQRQMHNLIYIVSGTESLAKYKWWSDCQRQMLM